MTSFSEQPDLLALARDWKAGRIGRVHPTIGQQLNSALVRAHEDAVPFRRATDMSAPSLAELVRRQHEEARR